MSVLNKVKEVLIKLKGLGYEAYLAGGFVRDLLNDIEPKDIDVFIIQKSSVRNLQHEQLKIGVEFKSFGKMYVNYKEGVIRNDVEGLIKLDGDYQDVDIIFMGPYHIIGHYHNLHKPYTIEDTVLNFDTSICGCYARLNNEGHLEVWVTQDYLDWKEKEIIYQYIDIPTTQDHLDRVKAKFNVDFIEKKVDTGMQFYLEKTL